MSKGPSLGTGLLHSQGSRIECYGPGRVWAHRFSAGRLSETSSCRLCSHRLRGKRRSTKDHRCRDGRPTGSDRTRSTFRTRSVLRSARTGCNELWLWWWPWGNSIAGTEGGESSVGNYWLRLRASLPDASLKIRDGASSSWRPENLTPVTCHLPSPV